MNRKSLNNDKNPHKLLKVDTYTNFINHLTKQGALYDERDLNKLAKTFSSKALKVQKEIDLFNQAISSYPIMTMIYLWVQSIGRNKVLGEKYLSMMWELVDNGILPHIRSGSEPVTFAEFASLSPFIVNNIRCFEDWPIEKQEIMVEFYC